MKWAACAFFAGANCVWSAEIDRADLSHLPAADIVVLGEVHDNEAHHEHQADAVRALTPAALVFEMLSPEQAAKATAEVRSDKETLERALEWSASGWPDFAMYYPIFAAAPDASIHGAGAAREALNLAMAEGAAAAFGSGAQILGLSSPLPEVEQAEREDEQFTAHCDALPRDILPGMVEAQRLRDALLAHAALAALEETGGPVAVITGNGHARNDWGIPAVLTRAAPDVSVLSLGQLEAAPEDDPPFDLWLVTAPAEREDPCAVFRN